ncbi:MAG: DUF3037 domain-containing protein [Anaerolineae bacterium]|nr:DUF3037 domain-containing protein [Anaerolineae bacterium]
MSELSAFDYAVLRVVPHVEREEFLNVGVILFCRPRAFLGVRIQLDVARLLALAPRSDLALVQIHLDQVCAVVEGRAEGGALGQMSQSERFHWLTTPRSTTIQVSPMHGGLCDDPQVALDDLFARLVA